MRLGQPLEFRVVCLLTALAVAGNGCTSMHRLGSAGPEPLASFGSIEPGDEVRLTTRDGREHRFTVKSVTASSLVAADGSSYELADVLILDRRQFNGLKTTLLIGGVAAGVLVLAYAYAVASVAGNLGSP